MSFVDVILSVNSPDAPPEAAERWTALLPPYAEVDGDAAVKAALENYFDDEKWEEWYGFDTDSATVVVIVEAPAAIDTRSELGQTL